MNVCSCLPLNSFRNFTSPPKQHSICIIRHCTALDQEYDDDDDEEEVPSPQQQKRSSLNERSLCARSSCQQTIHTHRHVFDWQIVIRHHRLHAVPILFFILFSFTLFQSVCEVPVVHVCVCHWSSSFVFDGRLESRFTLCFGQCVYCVLLYECMCACACVCVHQFSSVFV